VDEQHLLRHFVLCDKSPQGMAEEYNLLRANVTQKLDESGRNSLVVASPGPDEGKTLVALNLAICKARQQGKTVLLVEADLRNSTVHTYLGLDLEYGLSDYLAGDKELPDLLINPGIPFLSILPAGKHMKMSAEHIALPRMKNLVRELEERYPDRYIIFDTPPLLLFPEARILSSYAGGVLLVVQTGRTTTEDLKMAVDILQDSNVLGVVLNKSI
jgi:capsular exopolysaccharide synthesis family protein